MFCKKTAGCPDKEGDLGTVYCTNPIENASIGKCIIALHALVSKENTFFVRQSNIFACSLTYYY